MVVGVACLLTGTLSAWQFAIQPRCVGIDFVQFHMVGQHLQNEGSTQIYSDAVRSDLLDRAYQDAVGSMPKLRYYRAVSFRHEHSLETYSTPLLYTVFAFFEAKDYEAAIRGYWQVCLAAACIGVLGYCLALRLFVPGLFVSAITVTWFHPLLLDLDVANVNQIQLGMLGVFALILFLMPVTTGTFAASCWLAICVLFKPSLVFCAVAWFIAATLRRETRQIAWMTAGHLAGGLVAIAVSFRWFPGHAWIDWLDAIRAMPDDIIRVENGNFSALQLLQETVVASVVTQVSVSLLLLLMFAVACRRAVQRSGESQWSVRKAQGRRDPQRLEMDLVAVAVGCQIFMLSSRLGGTTTWCLRCRP